MIQRRFNVGVFEAIPKSHPCFEFAPRDDRSRKNEPKRVENDRETSLAKLGMSRPFPAQVGAELGADCCLLEAGGVRGNATYESSLTFAHLKAELPFENLMAVVPVDGRSLSAFVADSRRKLADAGPRGYAFFLHGDVGLRYDAATEAVTHVRGAPIDLDATYAVASCFDLGFGSGKNAAMADFAEKRPGQIPDADAAIPAKTLVMKRLCRELWRLLPAFDDVDVDKSGLLDHDEVRAAYVAALMRVHDDGEPEDDAEKIAAENMVDQLIACLDTNRDGKVDRAEYSALNGGGH